MIKPASALSDLLIRQSDQLLAARAHLNGNIAQRLALEPQPRGLMMIRAAHIAELARGPLFELVHLFPRGRRMEDREHKIILA